MRKFENLQYGDEAVIKASLDALADKDTNVNDYREAFRVLGVELGKQLAKNILPELQDKKKSLNHDSSTNALIELIRTKR